MYQLKHNPPIYDKSTCETDNLNTSRPDRFRSLVFRERILLQRFYLFFVGLIKRLALIKAMGIFKC